MIRFDPFRGLDELDQRLRGEERVRSMPLDAYRKGDVFHVELDLPGVRPDSIEVTVEKNVLSVSAERSWSTEGVEVVARERPTGRFSRELLLGESLDAEEVKASYENGVLRLAIPVAEEARPRRVVVDRSDAPRSVGTTSAA